MAAQGHPKLTEGERTRCIPLGQSPQARPWRISGCTRLAGHRLIVSRAFCLAVTPLQPAAAPADLSHPAQVIQWGLTAPASWLDEGMLLLFLPL